MLSQESPIPLYIQFKEFILSKIDSGEWQSGTKLPSERQLCESFDISRTTVRDAMKELMRDGLIKKVPGKGNFIQHKIVAKLKPRTSFTINTQMQNKLPSNELLTQKEISASYGLVKELQIPLESRVLMIHRLRLANIEPQLLQHAFIPLTFCPTLAQHNFESESLYQVLESTYGLVPAHSVQSVEARLAEPFEIKMLALQEPSAVLVIRQTTFLENGRPLEYSRTIHKANERLSFT